MYDLIVLIRNMVLAGILAWLGFELAPNDHDQPEQAPEDSVVRAIFG